MKNCVVTGLSMLFAASLAVPPARAQTETGRIAGAVTDPSKAAVAGANVTLKTVATQSMRHASSSEKGLYSFTNLLPGTYEIGVEAQGFATSVRTVQLSVGAALTVDFSLEIGKAETVIQVAGSAAAVNTETQTLGTLISSKEVTDLPTVTRNPYLLVVTAGNVSEDDPSGRSTGVAINGQRAASTNVLLDGAPNNDEFNANIGQNVPLDAVQEFSVLTNNFTAEYGRASGGIVNVVTKSGSNGFHGSAYEFGRNSKLASNSFDNNANGIRRPVFNRNQFGYAVGGPVVKNKLFFFDSTEWIRVRSAATRTAFVPTPQLIAAADANTRNFFSAFGQQRNGLVSLGTFTRSDLRAQGFDPCRGAAGGGPCAALPANLPLFQRVAYNRPSDSGGGQPQDSYEHVSRFDWIINEKTQLYGRYALESQQLFAGSNADSPYQGFDAGQEVFNHNFVISLVRTISPRTVSQSKAVFNRLNNFQPLGNRPSVPSLYFLGNQATSVLGTNVALPGYLPFSPGNAIPFGGPQNYIQAFEDISHTHGSHQFRFGGSYEYIRDNRTFGAFQEAEETLGTNFGAGLDNLLRGQLFQFQAAIDPQGKFPCGATVTPSCTVTLPVGQPNFSRSNRYHEFAVYGQDTWRLTPRLTLNLGLRWDYFGVQHNKNPRLDSNYYDAAGVDVFQGIRNGSLAITPLSPVGGLYRKDWDNFAPRLGFAWDLFGDGKTSFRGGYGIGYERNFGNVTFNVIQNPPNYAVVSLVNGVDFPTLAITTSNAGPLAGSSGSKALPRTSLRNVDPNIRTAYAHTWGASIEREVFKNVVAAVEYSGSRGERLYSLENPNRVGAGNVFLSDPCTPGAQPGDPGTCTSRLRNTQVTNINRRGNGGFSQYHAMNIRADLRNPFRSGLTLRANYTWSHAIDNLSSTFSESLNNLNLGLLDPFNPRLDRGNADFDIRNRAAISAVWDIPVARFTRHSQGALGYLLNGWSIASIITARSGSPYTLFDCTNAFAVCPRAAFDGPVPRESPSSPAAAAGQPNRFVLLDLKRFQPNSSFVNPIANISDFGPFPGNMTGRNAFRGPGRWNVDAALYKTTKINERFSLQLRGEAFNIANHSDLILVGTDNDISSINFASATRGVLANGSMQRRNVQVAAKLIF